LFESADRNGGVTQHHRREAAFSASIVVMDTVLDRPWTTDRFLAWEERQEAKYEFDGGEVILMTGGSLAHQRIVINLCVVLLGLLEGRSMAVAPEMRLRIGERVRYPDIAVCPGPLDQTVRTITDAVVIVEVLSEDTATTDRVDKLIDYAAVPSLRSYILLEQTMVAATVLRREPGGPWIAHVQTEGAVVLPELDIALPLAELYQGLSFPG
jgi:Uma2 family endonuclease